MFLCCHTTSYCFPLSMFVSIYSRRRSSDTPSGQDESYKSPASFPTLQDAHIHKNSCSQNVMFETKHYVYVYCSCCFLCFPMTSYCFLLIPFKGTVDHITAHRREQRPVQHSCAGAGLTSTRGVLSSLVVLLASCPG